MSEARHRHHYRILAVSDKVEPRIYGPNLRLLAPNVDFIISCGDLPYYYLEYIVSILDRPLYFVHGNHDRPEYRADNTVASAPQGAINLHHRLHRVNDIIMVGLEGSQRYNQNEKYQYTQSEMWLLALSLVPALLLNRLRYGRSLDILVTHSPPFGIHDDDDLPHIGFHAFRWLVRWFKPRYLFHGHQHVYTQSEITRTQLGPTEVVNIYPFRVLDLDFS